MAPGTAALTPNPMGEYAVIKTPDVDATTKPSIAHSERFGPSKWAVKYWYLGSLAQFLILASVVVYVYGQIAYFAPSYSNSVSKTIGSWWGVPRANTGKGSSKGHSEMTRPTYFFLFALLPLFVSLFLIELRRHYNVRQISSRFVLKFALIMRRKPRIFGWISFVSFGELLFLGVLIGGNVLVFYYYYTARYNRISSASKSRGTSISFNTYMEMIGLTLGFSCIFNMAFLFIPATRNAVWMEFMNISYANGVKYHRWIGVLTVLTAFFHCVGYYISWVRQGTWSAQALPCFDCPLNERKGVKVWMNVFGEIALLAFLIIGLTSIPWVRRKFYNAFYYFHHLFIVGVVFAVLHWNPIILWIFPTFLLYIISRSLSSANSFTPVQIKEFTTLDNDIVKIVISRSAARAGDYKVGQFVYLNVPSISKLQWHAFTIGSSPRANATTLTILLKSLGDWTKQLVHYSEDCKKNNELPTIFMDGYYGASLEMYEEYSTVCLVGGGIGVTPLFAILEDMVAKLSSHEQLTQRVFFIFTFRELSLLEEIHPMLSKIKELDPQERFFSFHFSLTRAPSDDAMNRAIDHERLSGKSHVLATQYSTEITKKTPQPFAEPLRSRASKSLMYLTTFFIMVLIYVVLKYNEKIKKADTRLSYLQAAVEILVMFLAVFIVYTHIFVESRFWKKTGLVEKDFRGALDLQTPSSPKYFSSDVHTFRDLVNEYNVAIGTRPDMPDLLCHVYETHQAFSVEHPSSFGNETIGVFISGPEALKSATEYAVADIGSSNFDIHEEEFEL
uniref:FAD-binding FR-type domain-containing protein n=1 Tax=Globisporangium ultimum (strain ATCC 200006 / CBS 805.95 / DAOM BR144) TaxID=431595 RepID=K3WXN1_GLOUD